MADARDKVRARLRLILRAEKALGITAVPVHASIQSPETETEPPTELAEPTRRATPLEPTAAQAPVDLWGRPAVGESAESRGLMPPPSRQPFSAPVLPTDEKSRRLRELDANEVTGCTRCRLCETRTRTVFGEGDADARIFFIGEGPGETEDQTGRPFVGKAGQLLDRMINAMGLKRKQVYIANIVKCRPPGNRVPAPDEVATCTAYLERQIEIVRPAVIVTLGLPAAQHMLQTKTTMGRLRGNWHEWRGIRLMPTFHPAYILRQYTPTIRGQVWDDLKKVLVELGLPVERHSGGDT